MRACHIYSTHISTHIHPTTGPGAAGPAGLQRLHPRREALRLLRQPPVRTHPCTHSSIHPSACRVRLPLLSGSGRTLTRHTHKPQTQTPKTPKRRQFIARLEKDFPGQSHHVRNDMVLLLVMAGNDYLKARIRRKSRSKSKHNAPTTLLIPSHAPADPP